MNRKTTRRLLIVLLMATLATTVFGCAGQGPQQPQFVVVTATLPAVQPTQVVQPTAPTSSDNPAPSQTFRTFPNPGFKGFRPTRPQERWPTPDIREYEPMPLPEVPSEGGSNPPPGVYVDPSIRGNGPPDFPYATYPINLSGYITGANGDYVFLRTININGTNIEKPVSIYDPGRTLYGWGDDPGIMEIGAVEIQEGADYIACMAVPYGAAIYPDGSPIKPHLYTKGDCEMG